MSTQTQHSGSRRIFLDRDRISDLVASYDRSLQAARSPEHRLAIMANHGDIAIETLRQALGSQSADD